MQTSTGHTSSTMEAAQVSVAPAVPAMEHSTTQAQAQAQAQAAPLPQPPTATTQVLPTTTTTAASSDSSTEPQTLIVLCGLVGSGKTTLAAALARELGFVRVCQDDLGSRRACEDIVQARLAEGAKGVIVDRQNFDRKQREPWLRIANSFPRVRVCCVVLRMPFDECARRVAVRTEHPTIHDAHTGIALLNQFAGLWREPSVDEGFDHFLRVTEPLPLELDATALNAVLARLYATPRNPRGPAQRRRLVDPSFRLEPSWQPTNRPPARFARAPAQSPWSQPRPAQPPA